MINDDFRIAFGERVKRKRQELGITQEELAERIGYVHKTSISKIEKGKINVPQDKIILLAEVLGVSAQYLMGKSSDTESNKVNLIVKRPFNEYSELTVEEQNIIRAFRLADAKDKNIVHTALDSYLEKDTTSSAS